jgi:hypothetical protein
MLVSAGGKYRNVQFVELLLSCQGEVLVPVRFDRSLEAEVFKPACNHFVAL